VRLITISDVIGELGTCYRAMKAGRLGLEKGKALAWVLGVLRSAMETRVREQELEQLQRLEDRLTSIEGERHGYTPPARQAHLTH
jgi:hypothetical protein